VCNLRDRTGDGHAEMSSPLPSRTSIGGADPHIFVLVSLVLVPLIGLQLVSRLAMT
jgi:hypothetical protein